MSADEPRAPHHFSATRALARGAEPGENASGRYQRLQSWPPTRPGDRGRSASKVAPSMSLEWATMAIRDEPPRRNQDRRCRSRRRTATSGCRVETGLVHPPSRTRP
jgi:hypothetical protein